MQLTKSTPDGDEIKIAKHEYNPEFQYYIGTPETPLEEGETYYLYMEFTGYLNEQLRGFYRSVYTNGEGESVWVQTI